MLTARGEPGLFYGYPESAIGQYFCLVGFLRVTGTGRRANRTRFLTLCGGIKNAITGNVAGPVGIGGYCRCHHRRCITAFVRLADKNTPFDIGLLHGRTGVLGAVLLAASFFIGNETAPSIKPALGLLALTVLGGVTLYFLIRRKGILPKSVIFIHGVFAVGAVHTLLFGLPF